MSRHKGRHRVPPRPHHMDHAKPGHCKFCGGPIVNRQGKVNKRATWHPQCALKWTIMNSPRDARRFVFLRDRGVCRGCGKNCAPGDGSPETVAKIIEQIMSPTQNHVRMGHPVRLGTWELDHIIPLSEARRRGNPPEMWLLQNMQSLCSACHVAKTAQDRLLYADNDDEPLPPRRRLTVKKKKID